MEWFTNLEDATKITIITLLLSNLVTVMLAIISYCQKNKELKVSREHTLEVLREEKLQSRSDEDRKLFVETIQKFAFSAGNILTSIESPVKDDGGRKIPFATLSQFDESYYKMYILLKNNNDREVLKNFQYKVRSLAGLPNPSGRLVWEEADDFNKYQELLSEGYTELPQPIYEELEKCLKICHDMIDGLLA